VDVDIQQSKPMVDETPLDERLAEDLHQTQVASQDAAEFHLREHERHVRILKACDSAIGHLARPKDPEMPTSDFNSAIQGQSGRLS
jgi:hypothetical protein